MRALKQLPLATKVEEIDLVKMQNFALRMDLAQHAVTTIERERKTFLDEMCGRYGIDPMKDTVAGDGTITRHREESKKEEPKAV